VIEAGGSRMWGCTALAMPGVQADVVMISAGRDEGCSIAIALGEIESEHTAIKRKGTLEIGYPEMHMADANIWMNGAGTVGRAVIFGHRKAGFSGRTEYIAGNQRSVAGAPVATGVCSLSSDRLNVVPDDMIDYLAVALGSALGGVARYQISGLVAGQTGHRFPWGTLVVNFSGCLLIGGFYGAAGPGPLAVDAPAFRLLLTYGILGGYTTFSTFSLETLNLVREGEFVRAIFYMIASVVTCVQAAALGIVLGGLL
jgi:fluoride exporter